MFFFFPRYQPVFGKLKSSLIMSKRTRNTMRKQIMQEPHNLIISNDIQVPNKNIFHINDEYPSEKIPINSDQNISQADKKRQKCVESTSSINVNTVETTLDQIQFHRFNQINKGQAIFQRNRQGGCFPLLQNFLQNLNYIVLLLITYIYVFYSLHSIPL